ncbi:glycine receptor subunit alphaZ1-like [Pocillopora damicornis]|uniref:glycine receptor subunit alphaZ1-like n=1 Tax=Pocillopora damicornis TaxID=46731 RepID=UPI000F55847F|nr:glycine receptor subunit alphaZ1-like [Pocillopora damicornis]
MRKISVFMSAIFFLSSRASKDFGRRSYENTTKVLDSLSKTPKYDKRIRPYHEGPPLNISVYMTVVSFGAIKEINMEYTLDIFFKQAWNDPRLRHDLKKPILLSGSEKVKFWLPDTFFLNVKTAKFHHVPAANSRVVIKPNGDIELSERLTVSASCRMNLREYPLDTQTCVLEILSYSYDINDMDYHWDDENAVIILDDEMSEFELANAQSERKLVKYVIGTYTHLVAKFVFKRRLAYSFIQIYSPTFLIVVLSWLSFWISKDAVPARIALGITTVLTIVTLMGSLRNSVPKVSYIKAIDSYLIVSFIFVFGVLLEYVAVLMHSERKRMKARKKQNSSSKDYALAEMEIENFSANAAPNHTNTPLVSRSRSAHSLPPQRSPSSYSLPVRPVSSYSLPPKSVLRSSYPRQNVPGPAIQHSPYTTNPPRTTIIQCIPSFCLALGSNSEVDIFDRIARIIFPLSFFVFNIGYYFRYSN